MGSAVPSILSAQALSLLTMREVLRTERKRQLRLLRAKMVTEGADDKDVSIMNHVIELLPAPRGGNKNSNGERKSNLNEGDDEVPELPPRKRNNRTTGHRSQKKWTRSDFVQLQVRAVNNGNTSGIDARGIFDLSQCNCSKGNGMFDIVLTHKELNKKWILQANSQEEVDKWIDAFRS